MDKERNGDHSFVPHEWPLASELQETAFVGDRAVEWLRRWNEDGPFFLHVGFAAPHSPIEPAPGFMDLYRDRPETLPWGVEATTNWLLQGRRGYRAMISQVDHYVGRIYECLSERGLLDNTIVVYTADHGEMAGHHGLFGKTCFYEPSVRVPLVVAGPGILPNQESPALVELVDLGKTLCDLCSVEPHTLDQGRSLAPTLRGLKRDDGGASRLRETVYAEMGCDKMIRDRRYKLMWGDPISDTRKLGRLHLDKPVNIPPSPSRLYDLETDPHEVRDLSQDPAYRDLLREMMAKLLIRLNENTQTQPNKDRGEYHPVR
jgi:arylsulfatase A-like enzyme